MDREEVFDLFEDYRDKFIADESNPMTGGSTYGSSGLPERGPDADPFRHKDTGGTLNGAARTNLLPIALIGMLGVALLVR